MEKLWRGQSPRKNRLIRIFLASATMFFIAFGIYLQLKADIGLSPWNALNQGISRTFGISYGTATVIVSFLVLAVDLLLKEHIGVGTLLDSLLIGVGLDILEFFDFIPAPESFAVKIAVFVLGLSIVCFGQYLYMSTALCCGARDSLTVALGRRFSRFSIGTVNNAIFLIVLILSCFLGATIGVGMVISVFGNGVIMDIIFRLVRFEPYKVRHEHIIATAIVLWTGKEPEEFI